MEQRDIPRLGRSVSCVGFGGWQLGADWGDVPEATGIAAIEAALAEGVTFIDTADAYGDGRSEELIGRVLATHSGERPFVATKMGRRVPQEHAEYTPERFREWNDRSRANLGVETLDLVQLHSPPTAVIEDDALFDVLDEFVAEGRVAAYGVSVETSTRRSRRSRAPDVATRADRPQCLPPEAARARAAGRRQAGVGIIARVPLASGLLSGRYTSARRSARTITAPTTATARPSTPARRSRASTTRRCSRPSPAGTARSRRARRWRSGRCAGCMDQPGVSVVIPGARNRSRPARTRPQRGLRRSRPTTSRPCGRSTTS